MRVYALGTEPKEGKKNTVEDENVLNNEVGGGRAVPGSSKGAGWKGKGNQLAGGVSSRRDGRQRGNKRMEILRHLRENMRFVCVLWDTVIPSNKKRMLNCQVVMPTEV